MSLTTDEYALLMDKTIYLDYGKTVGSSWYSHHWTDLRGAIMTREEIDRLISAEKICTHILFVEKIGNEENYLFLKRIN